MHEFSKAVLMAMMWLGRLEIIPILAILLKPFYRREDSIGD
ncbi:MAG: hypothetical protein RQ741_00505 [Wenzhouxiangellaceae bacterium]|nr:hypothetical protein [Wenzhouxiangellaceae bacterium]